VVAAALRWKPSACTVRTIVAGSTL